MMEEWRFMLEGEIYFEGREVYVEGEEVHVRGGGS